MLKILTPFEGKGAKKNLIAYLQLQGFGFQSGRADFQRMEREM